MEVAEAMKIESPFIEVKKGKEDELSNGELWYGKILQPYNLKTIYMRFIKPRNSALKNNLVYDQLYALEGQQMCSDGIIRPVLYQVMPSPPRRVIDDYLYPVTILGITLATLDGVTNRPLWKQMPVLDANGNQINVPGQGRQLATTRLMAYHYVRLNTQYEPKPLNDGTDNTDDGLRWTYGKHIIGRFINNQLDMEEKVNLNPLDYPDK